VNATQLFPEPRTDASRRLHELAARFAELRWEVRDLRQRASADTAAQAEARAALHAAEAQAHAFPDTGADRQVEAGRRRLVRLEKQAGERGEQLRVATDAAALAEGAITRHAREHREQLEAEVREDATAVAQRLAGAVAQLTRAAEDYRTAGARADALLRLIDPEQFRVVRTPDLPERVAGFLRGGGAAARIPVPLPVQPGHARVVEAPDTTDAGGVVDLAGLAERAA